MSLTNDDALAGNEELTVKIKVSGVPVAPLKFVREVWRGRRRSDPARLLLSLTRENESARLRGAGRRSRRRNPSGIRFAVRGERDRLCPAHVSLGESIAFSPDLHVVQTTRVLKPDRISTFSVGLSI